MLRDKTYDRLELLSFDILEDMQSLYKQLLSDHLSYTQTHHHKFYLQE